MSESTVVPAEDPGPPSGNRPRLAPLPAWGALSKRTFLIYWPVWQGPTERLRWWAAAGDVGGR